MIPRSPASLRARRVVALLTAFGLALLVVLCAQQGAVAAPAPARAALSLSVTRGATHPVAEGDTITVTAAMTSRNAGAVPTLTAIDWGDGTKTIPTRASSCPKPGSTAWRTGAHSRSVMLSHAFARPGAYVVRAAARSRCAGGETAKAMFRIVVRPRVVVDVTAPAGAVAGAEVDLPVSVTVVNSGPPGADVDWGDGTPIPPRSCPLLGRFPQARFASHRALTWVATLTHTYAKPGSYHVRIQAGSICFGAGHVTRSFVLDVAPAAAQP